jgi:hypothetical protein
MPGGGSETANNTKKEKRDEHQIDCNGQTSEKKNQIW